MSEEPSPILGFSQEVYEGFRRNLESRTESFRHGDGFETSVNSVLSALMARQSSLGMGLAESPPVWTAHIAPLILRSMIELLISMRWILLDPITRSKEYIDYGLGMEKLLLSHYEKRSADDEVVKKIIQSNGAWIESQQFQTLVSVNLGSWTGMSIRKMCDEIGDLDLYNFSYVPYSSCTHNAWNHVGKWNAKLCTNPLHKQHMVGTIVELWPIIDFVYQSAKYLELANNAFDEYYGVEAPVPTPISIFEEALKKLPQEESGKQ